MGRHRDQPTGRVEIPLYLRHQLRPANAYRYTDRYADPDSEQYGYVYTKSNGDGHADHSTDEYPQRDAHFHSYADSVFDIGQYPKLEPSNPER